MAARESNQTIAGRVWLNPFNFLVFAASIVCMVIMAAGAWMIWQQRGIAIQTASTNLRNLSRAVADQTNRVIESVELAEDRLLDHMATERSGAATEPMSMTGNSELHGVMRDIIAGMAQAYALLLVDASGRLVNSSNALPMLETNLADRSYFRFALANPAVTSFISETVFSRRTGEATFFVIRRLTGPEGEFKGLLMGAVQVGYMRRLFATSTLAPGGSITLVRPDGIALVSLPPLPPDATSGLEAAIRATFSGAGQGAVRRNGVFDGVEQLTVISDLPKYPLSVAVSEPFSAVIAAWRVEAIWIGGIGVFGFFAMLVTVFLTIRGFRDQQRLAAARLALQVDDERMRAEREIAEQHARFGKALDNMSQGLMTFDSANRLLVANTAAHKVFELPPNTLQRGMLFRNVIQAVAEVGNLSVDAATVTEYYMELVRRFVPAKFLLDVPGGRHLRAIFVPCDDGWLVTFEDVTELRKADERILYMALHDALTGLPNRVMLKSSIETALAANHGAGGFAVLCLDLDNFKDVNDTQGHPAGDKLLCEVAKRILSATRESDVVARLGGDEFAIVAYHDDDAAIAGLAARLVEAIGVPFDIDGQMIFVGTSIGIALAPANGAGADMLMKNADLALYRAKNSGRGRFAFFEPSMVQHLVHRRRMEIELRHALLNHELELFYQPIVKVPNRRIVGFEALMRWRHPARGMILPADFIPITEENGFIIQLGEWALRTACRAAMDWPNRLKVAVNLSPVQFRNGNLVRTIAAALETSGLAPNRLELEITENTMLHDIDATIGTIKEIKALGVRIVMDDFGTGYSSLAYLQRFPFDKIKIDRAFVRDIGQSTNLAIIRAVTSIATNMGIETTAEGIETEEQFERVADEGCGEAQGHLFSAPRPVNEIAALLDRENRSAIVVRELAAGTAVA